MGEFIKVLVDLLVLKNVSAQGKFSWLVMGVGLAVTVVVFAAGMVVATYYDRHPQAGSGPFIGVMVFAVLTLGMTLLWGWRYQNRLAANRRSAAGG